MTKPLPSPTATHRLQHKGIQVSEAVARILLGQPALYGTRNSEAVGTPAYDLTTSRLLRRGSTHPAARIMKDTSDVAIMDNAFNNEESRLRRLLTTIAHLMLYALAAVAAARVATYFGYTGILVELTLLIGNVILIIGLTHNDFQRLCVQCMQEVPADAGPRAERRQRLLWLRHWASTPLGYSSSWR